MKFLTVIFFLGLVLSACSRDQHEHPHNLTGKDLFELHCAECHSSNGMGNFLLGVPANNTELLNSTVRHKIIQGDGENAQMPVFEKMPVEEARKIVRYLRTLRNQ